MKGWKDREDKRTAKLFADAADFDKVTQTGDHKFVLRHKSEDSSRDALITVSFSVEGAGAEWTGLPKSVQEQLESCS